MYLWKCLTTGGRPDEILFFLNQIDYKRFQKIGSKTNTIFQIIRPAIDIEFSKLVS